MKVLVDTSVWSLAFRRKQTSNAEPPPSGMTIASPVADETTANGGIVETLSELIADSLIVLVGPIRQELLSGISDATVYDNLKSRLRSYDDLPITTADYEKAAAFYNTCRKHGVQGSHVDFLLCAIAYNHDLLLFTTDHDFLHYAKHLPIRLLRVQEPDSRRQVLYDDTEQ